MSLLVSSFLSENETLLLFSTRFPYGERDKARQEHQIGADKEGSRGPIEKEKKIYVKATKRGGGVERRKEKKRVNKMSEAFFMDREGREE